MWSSHPRARKTGPACHLVAEGRQIAADQLGQIAPYLRAHISRFGAYATDELRREPDPFDPLLKEVDFTAIDLAA
ncbi:hypothetical protein [Microtetraspora sp. NBRC 16547]|uniref:hypothetical protein n=1 Tax=Microtetraspora sp. NBRC 16547 TaxID=3030993 RepID=UPI0024A55E9C|nr:hypothetical protein [Microtetraspora sp. NBRC 16547]GLX02031.1 hypothetical protein Misp02_61170 [Microtetraspora sp. NBRC 16547]